MSREEAIKIIQNEYKCVDRECDIENNCGKCPYMMPSKEPILKAYEMAIKALSQEPTDKSNLERICEELAAENDDLRDQLAMRDRFKQEPCEDAVSREAVLLFIEKVKESGIANYGSLLDIATEVRNLPPVTQKSGKYTTDELREFADGISLSLCSKKSAQHWSYDEETAEQIRWLECLHSKVMTDIADTNCGAKMVEPQERSE